MHFLDFDIRTLLLLLFWGNLAATILLSTCGTLEAMHLLIRPDFGGMDALSRLSYLYVALLQGSYGAVLLTVLLAGRRPATR